MKKIRLKKWVEKTLIGESLVIISFLSMLIDVERVGLILTIILIIKLLFNIHILIKLIHHNPNKITITTFIGLFNKIIVKFKLIIVLMIFLDSSIVVNNVCCSSLLTFLNAKSCIYTLNGSLINNIIT